ncbi:hypothetical protein [Bradyrhizobium sp. STM 3562]|uniref:hypothetical protein n=1 Tax=Bradyrhizobium sp. STM 3562 TaxID=578924 RepID=UPI00388E215D
MAGPDIAMLQAQNRQKPKLEERPILAIDICKGFSPWPVPLSLLYSPHQLSCLQSPPRKPSPALPPITAAVVTLVK